MNFFTEKVNVRRKKPPANVLLGVRWRPFSALLSAHGYHEEDKDEHSFDDIEDLNERQAN